MNNNLFKTAELYPGGPNQPSFYWTISFTEGVFLHVHTDVSEMGTYYCDNTGFHLLNSIGAPYVPWEVSVNIENQSLNIPIAADVPRYYYLEDPNQTP